ncbi:hypothetical protein EVAR_81987_1 [Eumeta japonica]|uniref:Uncharacterized protein n=1 Tax=Eumeta variegata TaxID=151549 RepID=A0A4C1VXH6_EUMVA|nr:hypothetical protein EVAR_81987_1 [Eumeta japonica]
MLAAHSCVMSYGASSCADHYKQMTVNTESDRNIENEAYARSGTHQENFWKLGIISRQLNKACFCFEKVFAFQVLVTVMAVVGQKVKRRMRSICISACRLNLRVVADNHRRKNTRDLLRMWSQQARALRCFAGIPLAMPLLPAILSLSATYIIITLQFAHLI